MKKSIHILLLFCLFCQFAVISFMPAKAQTSVQAVMEVQVEVIPGSHVVSSSEGNIMLALVNAEAHDKVKVDIGRHTLRSPAGMDMYVSSDEFVKTSSGSGDMEIAMEFSQHRSGNGDVIFLLNGTVDTRGVDYGLYIGDQLTRVEYD